MTGSGPSTTLNPAASAIRIQHRVAPAKSPNCESGIWDLIGVSKTRKFPLLAEPKPSPAALS